MKKTLLGFAAMALVALPSGPSQANIPVLKTDQADLEIGAMTQVMGLGQRVDDQFRGDHRLYLFMKAARFRAAGRLDGLKFNLEFALGGEEPVNSNVSLSLLDLSVDVPLFGNTYLKVGQFKVPYGRERLTYSGYAQFIDRSVQDLGFRVGRDVGAALVLRQGDFTAIGGIFTGGGRDVPQRYLPENLGIPMLAARAGYGNVDEDPFALRNDTAPKATKWAFFVNGLFTKDSQIGHSTALNVKFADKSLLLNANWNPYIGKAPMNPGTWWQLGADAAVRIPAGPVSLSAEAEVNWAGYRNDYGFLHLAGGRAQAGVSYGPVEISARYSVLFPDEKFFNGAPLVNKTAIHEFTPSVAWYVSGPRLKVVADLPVTRGAPVVTEPNVGAYVATEQPDQVSSVAKGATIVRETVINGRLMLQASF